MNIRLRCVTLLLWGISALCGQAGSLAGKTPHPASPGEAPEGLAQSDWQGIRAAYEAGRHAFHQVGDGWTGSNPGQRLDARFDGRGFVARPKDGGWEWGLELRSYGFEGQERAVTGQPVMEADGPRLSCQWDGTVQEWWVNDSRGLEHGFTLQARPQQDPAAEEDAQSSTLLSFRLAVRGGLIPRTTADAQTVEFMNDGGGAVLTYSGLKVWDATGRILPSRFAARDAELQLVVEEQGARYPVTIDPIVQQAYLKASNAEAGDLFGGSVAVSGDTVVIGAMAEASSSTGVNGGQADNSAESSGAAYVFVRSGNTWSQQAYLKASNTEVGDCFGLCVAVSGDTVVVGALNESSSATGVNGNQTDNSAPHSGAAYVFVRSGATWSQQAYLKASNTGGGDGFGRIGDQFGVSVAVSGDTVVVGAHEEDSSATGVNGVQTDNSADGSGAAYVFVRSGAMWSQQAYLKASNTGGRERFELGDHFGASVAVSGDTVVVGAGQEDSSATGVNGDQADDSRDAGAAYVFVRSGATWSQQAYLKASNTDAGDGFGCSVAVSGDTVVVGAWGEDSKATGVNGGQVDNSSDSSGAAYVFVRGGATWSQQAYLKASNTGAGDIFGLRVAVSGNTLVAGAYMEASEATGVNGRQADNSALQSGAAYVFVRRGAAWNQEACLKASNTGAFDSFGQSVAVSGDMVVVGALNEASNATGVNGNQTDNSTLQSGAAYIFTLPDSEYALITTAMNGTVTGAGAYEPGATATLTAAPDAGYVFTGWTGDAGGTDNPLTVLMDSGKAIGASFGPDSSDADGDGLSAYLEQVVYGTNPLLADTDGDSLSDKTEAEVTLTNPLAEDSDGDGIPDADEDLDGDGFTNGQELALFQTAPNNGADRFTIALEYTASAHFLTFATVAGRTYRIERSLSPGDPAEWSERLSFTAEGGGVTVPLGPPSSARWFYRVRVSLN